MYPYRVFVSYSHEDQALAKGVVDALEALGFIAMWDRKFRVGAEFREQIRILIAHAHAFLPIVTQKSIATGWVHQEVGYALALNVPVVPVCQTIEPGEFLQHLHAISLPSDGADLATVFPPDLFERLISNYSNPSNALFECAEEQEQRAMLIAKYCRNIRDIGFEGLVRQRGGLTSFHIPDQILEHPMWRQRYGSVQRDRFHCRVQREERIELEKHARKAGCRLIVYPDTRLPAFGDKARIIRLKCLVEFLETIPDDKAQVALKQGEAHGESVTIVGDWFVAESVAASLGFGHRQTIFSRHAPSIGYKIDLFDLEFEQCLADLRWDAGNSRRLAAEQLKELITAFEKEDAG